MSSPMGKISIDQESVSVPDLINLSVFAFRLRKCDILGD